MYGDHRDLHVLTHSFPTRRSSDLQGEGAAVDVAGQKPGPHPNPSPAGGRGASSTVTILHDVGFGLEAGDRIGLLGANGAGKSTLVKTLVGELEPLAGERYAHPDLRIGYFAQPTVAADRKSTRL